MKQMLCKFSRWQASKTHAFYLIGVLLAVISLSSTAETDLAGEKHYKQCSACHLPTATGVPGMFPPLTNRLGPLASNQAGRDYLVMVVQAGLMGKISIDGSSYQGMMPPQGVSLGDKGTAEVVNYILQTFNADTLDKNSEAFTSQEVATIKHRYPNATSRDIHRLRQLAFMEQTLDD